MSTEAISEHFTTPQDDPNSEDKKEQSERNETQNQTTEREQDHTDDEQDDLIQLEKHGITVRISKYEIYRAKDITVEVIEDVPPELELKETEAVIAVGLKMSPSDAIFDSPVKVTMPHCGAFSKPKDAEVYIHYRNNDSTKFTAILCASTSNVRCVVRDRDLDIYVNHFSEYWIVAKIRRIFIGKRVVCTPIIPVSAPRNRLPVMWVNVRDQNIAEGQVPKGYEVPIPGEQFLIRWKSGGLQISCKESTLKDKPQIVQEREFRHLTEHKVMFEVDTPNITENEVNLHITLKQNTTKMLIVPMSLNATVMSEGGAGSPSTIASSSSSADNHPAETVGSGSTSETREPGGKCESDFDDILRAIAKKIVKSSDIDNLGGKLGFEPEDTQRYIQSNTDADYMGTLNMLRTWRRGTTESKEREQLGKALLDIKRKDLADKCVGDAKLK
ncbi:uncharacterized protein LOC121429278 isoform X2 [Lytechinus variegatus]|uniref:uncharacterized protein LOC121429278 isoform X2 n=1 Tax=Lytechinus variegatus TaxID=7654 RepID=UPI001BB0E395|nr:uncharacterized protein LOC121429278 isoform X2 [Lytechinus variegatus]